MTVYTGAFENGKSYTLNLLLAPKSGYHFADSESMQVTVNGQKAEKVLPYKGGKLIVTATFTVEDLNTISFDPNGGTGTMQPMKVKAGVGYTLPECTFTPPEGKEFAGWLAADGTVYPAGDVVISYSSSVLKATWKDKEVAEVTISFDPNGGTGTMQPMKVKSGENFTLPECTFTPARRQGVCRLARSKRQCVPRRQCGNLLHRPKLQGDVEGQLEGTPAVSGTTPFTDLTANWYKPAILWAYQNNVVAGTSPTTFDPERARHARADRSHPHGVYVQRPQDESHVDACRPEHVPGRCEREQLGEGGHAGRGRARPHQRYQGV